MQKSAKKPQNDKSRSRTVKSEKKPEILTRTPDSLYTKTRNVF